jgi:2-hydroxy-3-oxopropionate reductase
MKIGFIGLGIMGKPMSKNLIKAGHELFVCGHKAKGPVEELVALGAKAVATPKEAAEQSKIIFTMLPNSPQVKEVVLGENGIIKGAKPGSVVVDMSSISPMVSRELAAKLGEIGVEMLDAPVSGGEPKAIEGTLSVMVGGKQEVFDKCYPVLKAMSASAVLTGDIGAGSVAKLANQMIIALNIAGMSEAMVLATKAGVDPELVYQAIRGGLAGSAVLDAKVPMIMDRQFKSKFRITYHMKDLGNAIETAHEIGAPLPLTTSVFEMMHALRGTHLHEADHNVLVWFYEKLANVEVKRKS